MALVIFLGDMIGEKFLHGAKRIGMRSPVAEAFRIVGPHFYPKPATLIWSVRKFHQTDDEGLQHKLQSGRGVAW